MTPEAKTAALKAPFPWFGGKSRAARLILDGIGPIQNYVEPFGGSLAVLLANTSPPTFETVNDLDRYIANFWRAVKHDPAGVAEHADWPVNEADLEARHYWLVSTGAAQLAAGMASPDYYDVKIAGWWVWGQCCWIGRGWCDGQGPWHATPEGWKKIRDSGRGVNRQLPHMGNSRRGVNRQLPHMSDSGLGVIRQPPQPGSSVQARRDFILSYMEQLANRLRSVRVACGDWRRVLTPTITFKLGVTGVVLDPPYGEGDIDYTVGGNQTSVADEVRDWAIANGDNPDLRIALCGYEGRHNMPGDWRVAEWRATGGYANTAKNNKQGNVNRHRERVWFLPHCPKPTGMLVEVK